MSATEVAGPPEPRGIGRRIAGMSRARLIGIVLGVSLGVALGAWYRFFEHATPTSFIAPTVTVTVAGIGVLGLLGLIALAFSIPKSTKPIARTAFTAAVALIVALPVGYVVGPSWQPAQTLSGALEVQLTDPTTGRYAGSATCHTEENSDVILQLGTDAPIGAIDGVPLTVTVFWTGGLEEGVIGVIQLGLDGASDLSGHLVNPEVDANRWTGRASFGDLTADDLDPDPDNGPRSVEGTVSWTCG